MMIDPARAAAHFLHEKVALDPVLAVPIEAPRAISWRPGKEVLLVAAANGAVTSVEPSFGARFLFAGPPEPVQLAANGEHVAILTATGRVEVWTLGEAEATWSFESGLTGDSGLRFWADGVAVIGDDADGRRVRVYAGARLIRDVHGVPEGVALGTNLTGELQLARSVEAGLSVVPFGSALPNGTATGHQLRFTPGGHVLGVAIGGATLWTGKPPLNVRLLDTSCAALCADGQSVALGTRGGIVALSDMGASPAARAHPPRVNAHETPVRAMSFSTRGRWLATVAENCRLWSY